MFPIRCFTCGKVVSHKWEPYVTAVQNGEPPALVLDRFGFSRFCCRRMFVTHVDLTDKLLIQNCDIKTQSTNSEHLKKKELIISKLGCQNVKPLQSQEL